MTIEDGIKAYLTASPYPLAVETRVWSHAAPDLPGTDPYIVFYRISPDPLRSHSGVSDLMRRTYQFSVFSPRQSEALGISDALRRILSGFSGTMGDVDVQAVHWRSDRHFRDPDTLLHHVSTDFEFHYTDTNE